MPIYVYQRNKQISTNAIRNNKVVKTIYAKEQGKDVVCVWGIGLNLLPFTYTKDATSVTITGLRPGVTWEHLIVPETIEDLPVTQIASRAFKDKTNLKSIELPNSLKDIGSAAFYNCTGLTSITILNGVTSIDYDAFYNCTGLTSVTIPDSVTSIGNEAFYKCTGLTEVTIGNSVTNIARYAFNSCTSLTNITIPNNVTSIGDNAFSGCSNLIAVNWNATACTEAGSNSYPIFQGCSNLATVNISENVTTIPSYAFRDCSGLTSIVIPDSVTSIGSSAFRECTSLTSVTIPDSVTSIGSYAFENCDNAQDIYITDIAAWCNISGLNYLMEYGASNKKLYLNNQLVTSLSIPNKVTTISDSAFRNFTELMSVTIPSSVTSIGEQAFAGCSNLATISTHYFIEYIGYRAFADTLWFQNQPDGMIYWHQHAYSYKGRISDAFTLNTGTYSIVGGAFYNQQRLTNITIPDSVERIGSYAFHQCTGLTNVTIGSGVKTIEPYAFWYCRKLTSIEYNGTKAQWKAIQKGLSWNLSTGNYTIHCTDGDIPK